ncbi:unnamed protein product [Brachionus calyciflorus]|uniref:Insecticide toxin TcdB middle/N-terminal domain-containing protein n=1 Tax=Brachionus calyciflorus TaxID=104777 RepID=A0A814HSM9_9BILA|nr:unnamed protein product [Brachionus calyciflorus]
MNNDGYMDIVGIGHSNQMIIDFNNQSSFEKRKIINLPSNWSKVSWNSVCYRLVDIFSNGFKYFFTIPERDISFLNDHVEILGSLGTTNFSSINGWSIGNHYREFIDLNNDNLPDMVGIDSLNRIHVGIATPSSQNWKTKYFATSIENVKKSNTKEENVFNADLNGDGLPDFVFFQCNGIFVSLNMANNFSTEHLLNSVPDLKFLNKNMAKIYLNLNKKPRLEAIRDSLGNEKKISYQSTANKTLYTESKFNFKSTYSSKGFAFDVVSEFWSSDGIGGMSSITYKYGEYKCSKIQGRSCSFAWIKSQNQNSKIFSTQQFHHKHPLTGMLLSKSSFYANKLITRTNFTYSIKQTDLIGDKKSWTILIKSKESEFYDIDGLFLKKEIDLNEYDDFGNVIQSKSSLIDRQNKVLLLFQFTIFNFIFCKCTKKI